MSAMGGHGEEHSGKPRGDANIVDARLTRIDGAPVWLVEGDRGQRFAISARTGELREFSVESAERIARGWLEQDASINNPAPAIAYVDTILAPIGVHDAETLKPFHRFAVGDGDRHPGFGADRRSRANRDPHRASSPISAIGSICSAGWNRSAPANIVATP